MKLDSSLGKAGYPGLSLQIAGKDTFKMDHNT